MSIDNVVNINISRSAAAVSRAGFGTMLILGSAITAGEWGSDRIREYTKAADLLTDGFTTSDPEYKFAVAAFSQDNKPVSVKVGRRLTAVAQINTLTPTAANDAVYTVTINGTEFEITSDSSATAAEIVTALIAEINAGDEPVTASGTTTLVLTADQAGIGFSVTCSANLANVDTTANVGVATDLPEISAIDDDWYALVITSTDVEEAMEAAAYIESVRKIFVHASSQGAIIAAGSTDLASRLEAAAYDRTAVLYSGDHADGAAAAWLGHNLPLQPGSSTYKFKTLSGITADNLSATQRSVALAKNCNVYTTVGGLGMTEEGVVASGEFLDVIVGVDWLHVEMQADIFQQMMDADKIPYTDVGAGVIQVVMEARLRAAVRAGILAADPAPTVSVPAVADQLQADRAARAFPGITFTGTLAGAIHSVTINGNVSV